MTHFMVQLIKPILSWWKPIQFNLQCKLQSNLKPLPTTGLKSHLNCEHITHCCMLTIQA